MEGSTVLDTSVIIKWFRQGEVLAEQALALRDAYLEGTITVSAPTLLIYELGNVLRYKDLTTGQVQGAVQSLFDLGLELVAPTDAVMYRAIEIARTHDTTVYDATFAAMAEPLNATLVTADEQLAHKLKSLPFVRSLGDVNDEKHYTEHAEETESHREKVEVSSVTLCAFSV